MEQNLPTEKDLWKLHLNLTQLMMGLIQNGASIHQEIEKNDDLGIPQENEMLELRFGNIMKRFAQVHLQDTMILSRLIKINNKFRLN